MNDGLKASEREAVRGVLAQFPAIQKAVLFGSRAMGTYSPASDIDLVLYGEPLTLSDEALVASKMEDLDLPLRVDLVRYHTITSEGLLEHIRRHGRLLYDAAAGEGKAGSRDSALPREGWPEVKLAEIIDVKHGFAFPGGNIRETPPGDILLTPGNVAIGGGFKSDKYKYFDGQVPEEYILHENDLVVTMTDLSKQADTLGYPALVPKPRRSRFLHNQRLGKVLIRDTAKADKLFVSYLLRTTQYRHEILASATGTTVKHTSPSRILAFKTRLPPLPEQRAIAHILGTLDDKIELNRRMNGTLEAMARTLFKSWFVDFDPVRAKAEGRDPGLPQHIADLFPDSFEDSELGAVPGGWQPRKWGDLVSLEYGKALGGYAREDGAFAVYGTNGRIGTHSEALCPHPGIIVGRKGAYRGVHYSAAPFFVIDTAFYVAPRVPLEMRWVYYELLQMDINSMDSGSAIPSTSRQDFYGVPVLAPPFAVQQCYVKLLQPLWIRQAQNENESRTLAALRDTLLPKLISGELRVKDAERFVSEGVA